MKVTFLVFGTFTGSGLKDLTWAAALVLRNLNDHGSGAGLASGGLEAPPFQTGQLTSAPRRPLGQMAVP